MKPPAFEPMLAGRGRPVGDLGTWVVEPKLDGWRCIVGVEPGHVVVRTRSGRRLGEAVSALDGLAARGSQLVLDGELVAGEGRCEDFYRLSQGLFARRPQHLTFMAFDLLWLDGVSLVKRPYDERRACLEALDLGGAACLVPSLPGDDVDALLAACEEQAMEGVVLKRRRSIYRPGQRTSDWRKVKCPGWATHFERRLPAELRGELAGLEPRSVAASS